MQIRHFRRFRRNGPFLEATKTRFTKHRVCASPTTERRIFKGVWQGLLAEILEYRHIRNYYLSN